MSFPSASLPALERSLKVTNISNDPLPMGRLTHFTPFHRNKGGLSPLPFRRTEGKKIWRSPAESRGPSLRPERHAPAPALSLVPKGNLLVQLLTADVNVRTVIYTERLPKLGQYRACGLTLATGRPPGKRRCSDRLPTWLPTISRAGQKQPIFPPPAKKMSFKDPTTLIGGLQFCHQTCQ